MDEVVGNFGLPRS